MKYQLKNKSKKQIFHRSVVEKNTSYPALFLVIITMIVIAVLVQLDRMQKTRDIRAKAYIQTATGVRIEGEEMTLSGSVTKNAAGAYIQFGP
jgi:hypothetical protein